MHAAWTKPSRAATESCDRINSMPLWLSVFTRRSYFILLFSVVLALGTTWMLVSAAAPASTTSGMIPSPREDFLAPDFALATLDGEEIRLSDLRGKVIVLNLWASWCPPCRAEMPALNDAHEQYVDRGLVVLAVNMTFQDSEMAARAFADEFSLGFPVLLDRTGNVGRLYQMRALPSTFFIDRQGVIRKVIIGGPLPEATLLSEIEALIRREG
jgi:cytochrome c biogenesis protein CcmG/thiol:disulfide interchange protein DsbE